MRNVPALLVVCGIALSGCHRAEAPAFARAFGEAERAQTAGRFLEAAQRFDRAAARAESPRERAHAEYLAAKMLERGGDVAQASARLERMATQNPPTEHTAHAAYDVALLRIDHGNDVEGFRALELFVERFSGSGLAPHALRRLAIHRDEVDGKKGTIAWLDGLGARLGSSELAETIAYQAALRTQETGDLEGAHARFLAIATRFPYPVGNTFDDSLYRASEIDESLGRPREGIDHLEHLLSERETASMIGTYQRPRYTPALLRVATLYRDRLGDRAKAREAFHRLYADFTTSPLRDDALWQEAALFRLDGDKNTACSRLSTLVSDFPDSRYVPCASVECPTLARPEKSKAPKTCHEYIRKSASAEHER